MTGSLTGTEAGAGGTSPGRERRVWERYQLDDAEGKLVYRQVAMPCRIVDISLGGCCIRTQKRFTEGALAKVEVTFALHGIAQRIGGITQWTGRENQIGIRFVYATPQTKNDFAALLTGLIDAAAVETLKEAVASAAIVSAPAANAPAQPLAAHASQATQQQAGDLAAMELVEGESQAVVHFVKDGSEIAGTIVDLSLEGCTLRLVRPFTVGIYVRVEISLHVRGLILQLAGVSQEIHDKYTVAFRFLDVSRRRSEELAQVVEEVRAAKKE
jgi:hypothetical protein